MRELSLEPCQPQPWRFSLTESYGQEHDIPDLVQRDFTAAKPGEKMVGDITYISTWEGWLYLSTVIDAQAAACTAQLHAIQALTDTWRARAEHAEQQLSLERDHQRRLTSQPRTATDPGDGVPTASTTRPAAKSARTTARGGQP